LDGISQSKDNNGAPDDGATASAAGDAWQQAQDKLTAPEAEQSPHHPMHDVTLFQVSFASRQ